MTNPTETINTTQDDEGVFRPINIERNERAARKMIPKLLKVAGRIPFADDLAAAYYAARDPKTPTKAKAVLLAAVAYFVMPVDAVPDMIVGLGYADDATVLATALGVVGAHIRDSHRRLARRLLRLPEPIRRAD
jgi:uncharacterized membrane protein YkvA (DUF1232 family)